MMEHFPDVDIDSSPISGVIGRRDLLFVRQQLFFDWLRLFSKVEIIGQVYL